MAFRDMNLAGEEEHVVTSLRSEMPQVISNLDADRAIPDEPGSEVSSRRDLLGDLSGHDPSGDLTAPYLGFCRSHQQEGTPRTPEEVGHVRELDKFAKWIRAIRKRAPSLSSIKSQLRNLALYPPEIALEEQQLQLEAWGLTTMSEYQMWSYHSAEDFSGSRAEAVRRLGLGHVSAADELLRWTQDVADPRIPTAWDADDNSHWRPGGESAPLDGKDDGIPESVHHPTRPDELRTAWQELG